MKLAVVIPVLFALIFPQSATEVYGFTIENYVSQNYVLDVDVRDEVIAIGTTLGLTVIKDGKCVTYTMADGLPHRGVPNVAIADRDTIYIGPYYVTCYGESEPPSSAYRVSMRADGIETADVLWGENLSVYERVFATGPDGSLWVARWDGAFRFDGAEWHKYAYSGFLQLYPYADICFRESGGVYIASRFDIQTVVGNDLLDLGAPFEPDAIAAAPDDAVWAFGDGCLWRCDGGPWQMVSNDPALPLAEDWMNRSIRMLFDEQGRLWIVADHELLLYENGQLTTLTEGAGVSFDRVTGEEWFLTSIVLAAPQTLYLGTAGAGLLAFDGSQFSRFYTENSIPGDFILDLGEDDHGKLWVVNGTTRLLGAFDGERFTQTSAPWFQAWGWYWMEEDVFPLVAQDINGEMWFRSETGAACLSGGSWSFYDSSNSGLDIGGCLAIDSEGTKWFANPFNEFWDTEGPLENSIVSFDGDNWVRYSATDYLAAQVPTSVSVGPGDKKWFARDDRGDSERRDGYTTYDGSQWEHLDGGSDLPRMGAIYFDIHGNALLANYREIQRQNDSGEWEIMLGDDALQGHINDLQSDSEGRMFIAASDGLYIGSEDSWVRLQDADGLCPEYDCALEHTHRGAPEVVTRVFIDHDGDKWIGAPTGLSRMQDGGAAAQKLTLRVEEDDTTVALMGEFINTYTTMPVSLWLACDYGGTLYFYPDWTPTMACTDMVLEAHLFEERELCSFDKASLPLGTLTFIGGISLRGGSDLMIGPRDNKLSFATWSNE